MLTKSNDNRLIPTVDWSRMKWTNYSPRVGWWLQLTLELADKDCHSGRRYARWQSWQDKVVYFTNSVSILNVILQSRWKSISSISYLHDSLIFLLFHFHHPNDGHLCVKQGGVPHHPPLLPCLVRMESASWGTSQRGATLMILEMLMSVLFGSSVEQPNISSGARWEKTHIFDSKFPFHFCARKKILKHTKI